MKYKGEIEPVRNQRDEEVQEGEVMEDNAGGPFGKVFWIIGIVLCIVIVIAASTNGNDDGGKNTAQVFSGNEALSRNTGVGLNFGEINNNFYDCIGSNACTFSDDTTTNTSVDNSQQNQTDVRVESSTEVNGNQNTIVQPDGRVACQSPYNQNTYSPGYCQN